MALPVPGNSKSEDSEFEPDNNFFDNFLDGMDSLIDNCRDSDENWIAGKAEDESDTTSSGGDRMVIDLPSSPDSKASKEGNTGTSERGDKIKATLTNRVLAHLDNGSKHHQNKSVNAFPSNQLVVEVLDRLKKSVQDLPKSSSGSFQNILAMNQMTRECSKLLPFNQNKDVRLNDFDSGKRPDENMAKLYKWIYNEETSPLNEPRASLSRGLSISGEQSSKRNKDKKKKKKHRKHKSSRSNESLRHRRHKRKSKKKLRKESNQEKKGRGSEPSLESVSSADDDILNRRSEDGSVNAATIDPIGCSSFKPDCEEGEVTSSSDWESERIAKKRRKGESLPLRSISLSPKEPWPHRCVSRRSPTWLRQRLRPEDERFYRLRSPDQYFRTSPWREQALERPRHRIPVPPSRSISPVPIHLQPRSPSIERISSPPFVDSFDCPDAISPRRIDHSPLLHRPRSPHEAVQDRYLLKHYPQMDVHAREVKSCPTMRVERRYPPDYGLNDRSEKLSLVLRCFKEIRHLSCKPGRFICDPKSKSKPAETASSIGRFSSPLCLIKSQSVQLSFTTPITRHIGTSSTTLKRPAVSVGCQVEEKKLKTISEEDQVYTMTCVGSPHYSSVVSAAYSAIQNQIGHSVVNVLLQTQSSLLCETSRPTETTGTVTTPQYSCCSTGTRFSADLAVSETVTLGNRHVPVAITEERKECIHRTLARVSVPGNSIDPFSSQRALEMWKSIVSFRYPDLNEKEREQVVLMKSMEAGQDKLEKG